MLSHKEYSRFFFVLEFFIWQQTWWFGHRISILLTGVHLARSIFYWLNLHHSPTIQRITTVNTLFHFTQKCKPCGKDHSLSSLLFDISFFHYFLPLGLAALWWHGGGVILAQSGPRVHQWPKLKAEQPLRSRLWCNESHLPHIAPL